MGFEACTFVTIRCTGGEVILCTGEDVTATAIGMPWDGLCTGLLMACVAAWRMLGLALPVNGEADGWPATGEGNTAIGVAAARPGRVLMNYPSIPPGVHPEQHPDYHFPLAA